VDPYTCAKVRHDPDFAHQNVLVFFPFVGFFGCLQLATAKAPRSILTQNMPKLAVPRKDVPFRGRDHKI